MNRSSSLAAIVTLVSMAVPADAQTPPSAILEGRSTVLDGAILEGQVVDSITGDPIEGVLIRIDFGAETFTDARGEFRLTALPAGRRLFAILTSDCRITWGEVDVVAGIPRRVRLKLPHAFGAAAEERQREEAGRQRTGGRRIEAEEIDRSNASSVLELIRRIAPNMVGGVTGQVGATPTLTSGRNRTFTDIDNPPVVVIDNVRIPGPEVVLAQMRPSEVQVLEILPGSAAGWEFGSSGAGGVIKITLRRGLATGAADRRVATQCVVPEFPRG